MECHSQFCAELDSLYQMKRTSAWSRKSDERFQSALQNQASID